MTRQRVERSHGTAFDSPVRTARDQLHARRPNASEGVDGPTNGAGDAEIGLSQLADPANTRTTPRHAGPAPYGETRTRTGDTTIFSRVLYQLSYLAARRPMLPSQTTRLPGR
jgi:hypothetical protein